MGTSAFDPVVLADVRSVKNKINISGITGDVLVVGDVIRYDPTTDIYVLAKANNSTNANFLGIVEAITGTDMTIVYSGEISLPNSVFTSMAGHTLAQVFYLSDTLAGKLSVNQPTNPGSVIKPVILVAGTVDDGSPTPLGDIDGIVINTLGQSIVGDSTVDLSDIQPVGSVSAFAGNTSDIPGGWDICDGGYLSIATYPDLYAALNDGQIYGLVQTITMSKVTNSGAGLLSASNLVGSKFYVSRGTSIGSLECTILGGTISGTVASGVTVFVNPLFVNGPSAGTFHNDDLAVADTGRVYLSDGTPLDVVYLLSAESRTNFKKPDLRARFIVGDSRGLTGVENTAFNSYTVGIVGGEESHTLVADEMPIHNHGSSFDADLEGDITANLTGLQSASSGLHSHNLSVVTGATITFDGSSSIIVPSGAGTPLASLGTHTHAIDGTISISSTGLTPIVVGTIQYAGGDGAHNNVPQHMALLWIIKTRKDSYAKILRLGTSGGGAIIAKNTPKRWARASSGAGCTVDISYGAWGVARLGTGNYSFTHDMLAELGTADQSKYIVEATVIKSGSGATQMFLANPYTLEGLTFGVRVWEVLGATFSDNFQYLSLTVYGGSTAI
jgi:microcystin-dependent protein